MHLTRLIYVSRRNPDVPTDLEGLLETSRRRNAENQITGALWVDGTYFVQVLEGARHVVSATYHRISRDPRHTDLELVSCESVSARAFADWSMGYCGDTRSNRQTILKFSGHDQLVPGEMSSSSLLSLVQALEVS